MKKSDIPAAIEAFTQQFGPIQPLNPHLIGFSWAIGTKGDNVVLARKYPLKTEDLYEFSLMTKENYEHYKENE